MRDQPIDADPETLEKFLHNIALSTGVPDGNFRVPQPLNSRAPTVEFGFQLLVLDQE